MAIRKRSPIDRRFAVSGAQSETAISRLPANTIMFVDAWGNPIQRFDFDQLLGVPLDLRAFLADAFPRALCRSDAGNAPHDLGSRPPVSPASSPTTA
ncbi:hypothetical protein GA830_19170 (plasmid) [Mesorhizobium sp. NBSH29]|nr:hypothetical protein GA830_19170 [Mesorhizobium sp. NBSH29]